MSNVVANNAANANALSIIEQELEKLLRRSERRALNEKEIKSLETLVKTKALIMGEPTQVSMTQIQQVSNKEILQILMSDKSEKSEKKKLNASPKKKAN